MWRKISRADRLAHSTEAAATAGKAELRTFNSLIPAALEWDEAAAAESALAGEPECSLKHTRNLRCIG